MCKPEETKSDVVIEELGAEEIEFNSEAEEVEVPEEAEEELTYTERMNAVCDELKKETIYYTSMILLFAGVQAVALYFGLEFTRLIASTYTLILIARFIFKSIMSSISKRKITIEEKDRINERTRELYKDAIRSSKKNLDEMMVLVENNRLMTAQEMSLEAIMAETLYNEAVEVEIEEING